MSFPFAFSLLGAGAAGLAVWLEARVPEDPHSGIEALARSYHPGEDEKTRIDGHGAEAFLARAERARSFLDRLLLLGGIPPKLARKELFQIPGR